MKFTPGQQVTWIGQAEWGERPGQHVGNVQHSLRGADGISYRVKVLHVARIWTNTTAIVHESRLASV